MPGFFVSRAASRVRVHSRARVRSPFHQGISNKDSSFNVAGEKSKLSKEFSLKNSLPESGSGNRVMVVVDSRPESKGALEWALSHTVQNQDTIILLHVTKQDTKTMCGSYGNDNGKIDQRAYDLLRSASNMCQLKKPEVRIEMACPKGKEKGATIVEEANRTRASLLVLGHRRQSFLRRLQMIWASKKARCRVVDYCIQNAKCMAIAVRQNNRKYGGYLITTKRHKNFWLLA